MAGNLSKKTTKIITKICAFLSSYTTCIITNSYKARDDHMEMGYCHDKWLIIPNGFDTSYFKPCTSAYASFREELRVPKNTPLIGLVGRIDPAKDHHNFFSAVDIFHQSYPHVHFVLCGEGIKNDNPTIRQLMPSNVPLNQIHLLGLRTDLARILPALDLVTLSSQREAFPNIVGEAMSCGCICVVTDVGDCHHIVENSGFVVPPRNPIELARAWKKVIGLPAEKILKLRQRARQRVQEHFSLNSVVHAYENLYIKWGKITETKEILIKESI